MQMRNRDSQNGEKEDTDFWGTENKQAWEFGGRGFVFVLKERHGETGGSVKRDQSIILPLGLLKTANYKQRDWCRLRVEEKLAKPSRDLQLCFDLKNNSLYQT